MILLEKEACARRMSEPSFPPFRIDIPLQERRLALSDHIKLTST